MALGYDSLLADFYWMRTIQYYGRREEADKRPVRYKNLSTLLDITTTLDPDLMDAYRAGSIFLGRTGSGRRGAAAGSVEAAGQGNTRASAGLAVVLRQRFCLLLVSAGLQGGRRNLAGCEQASGCAPLDGRLWPRCRCQRAAPWKLRSLYGSGSIEESSRADVRENARNHLLSIQVARDLWTLEFLLEKFRAKTRILPSKPAGACARANAQVRDSSDPLGTPYEYDPETGNVVAQPRNTKIQVSDRSRKAYKEQLRLTIDD